MTNEEAIEWLEGLKRYLLIHGWQDFTAIDMAIQALKAKDNIITPNTPNINNAVNIPEDVFKQIYEDTRGENDN